MTNCNIILLYTEDKKVDSCPERETAVTAVTAGGVVGAQIYRVPCHSPAVEIQTVGSYNTYK